MRNLIHFICKRVYDAKLLGDSLHINFNELYFITDSDIRIYHEPKILVTYIMKRCFTMFRLSSTEVHVRSAIITLSDSTYKQELTLTLPNIGDHLDPYFTANSYVIRLERISYYFNKLFHNTNQNTHKQHKNKCLPCVIL
jgi:hypothetical protein